MIEIFRDISSVRVGHFQSVLEEQGIPTFIRNNNLSVVEIPIPVFYPALCIMNEEDHERAINILNEIIQREQSNEQILEINCPSCHETNPANFETCWSCEGELTH